jgi:hypothetical protein
MFSCFWNVDDCGLNDIGRLGPECDGFIGRRLDDPDMHIFKEMKDRIEHMM